MCLEVLGSECFMAVDADEGGGSTSMIFGLLFLESSVAMSADEGDHLSVEISLYKCIFYLELPSRTASIFSHIIKNHVFCKTIGLSYGVIS